MAMPPTPVTPDLSQRQSLVDAARAAWVRHLIDSTRRNHLLYYRHLRTGTLDLSAANSKGLDALLNGQTVPLSRLLPHDQVARAIVQAQTIRRRAVANREEKGLETLFLALGSATWTPSDGGRPPNAPIILLPMAVEVAGREAEVRLRRTGEPQLNLALLHVLEHEFGCPLDPAWLLEDIDEPDEPLDPTSVASRLLEVARSIKGFAVHAAAVLGNFSFQKLAMVQELREHGAALAAHEVIAALAGDATTQQALRAARHPIDPQTLDAIPPDQEFLILDADASQRAVIAAVLQGQNGVIQGPPGTGKSQTIANLITTLAAQGKRVLFVAEKRAALEVVLRRLQAVDLGHLALDLHGADVSRRELAQRFANSLAQVRRAPPVDATADQRIFQDRRSRLNAHVARLHMLRLPANASVYTLQGRLLRFAPEGMSTTRWRGAALQGLTRDRFEAIHDLLLEAGGFADLFLGTSASPWAHATLTSGDAVQQALEAIGRLTDQLLPHIMSTMSRVAEVLGIASPASLAEVQAMNACITKLLNTLRLYQPELFRNDLTALAQTLAPAQSGILSATWSWLTTVEYRAAVQTVNAARRAGSAWSTQLIAEIATAAELQQQWKQLTADQAVAVPDLETVTTAFHIYNGAIDLDQLRNDLYHLAQCLGRTQLDHESFALLIAHCRALLADQTTPPRLPRLRTIEQALHTHGVDSFIAELRQHQPPVATWPLRFEHAWLSSCLEQALSDEPELAGFHGATHSRFVDEFRVADQTQIERAAARVWRAHAERVITAMNAHPEQEALVRREAEKKTRHLPLRKLLPQAAEVLTTLCPCWMASPLSVSHLIPADRRLFDLVIFDEASQVLPEDAIASLLRGATVVVAGDQQQLPPTTFFAAGEEEYTTEDEAAATVGFESLLDLMVAFLNPWPLRWHYRSRDEALIAFANHHLYDNRLVTFPSPHGSAAVQHVLVPFEIGRPEDEESVAGEVQQVVKLIIAHAQQHPSETLGVIALGIKHAQRVEQALDAALRNYPELDAFFDQQHTERFFVKNLERVQGDERDAIILTIGYGKDQRGRLPYRFGPLLLAGGERRLNVAITRARHRLTLVSSFDHTDMNPNRSQALGVILLRQYLQYAASGGKHLAEQRRTGVARTPFDQDLFAALTAQGLPLLAQWGESSSPLDFVAQHPQQPERLVLAIESDGSTYMATPTARDRDRLRQQHLETLGWRFHRIWSQDWMQQREAEIARVISAYQAALQHADSAAAVVTTKLVAPPATPTEPLAQQRTKRPQLHQRASIESYRMRDLVDLINWINSDGRLRTDDEIIDEMVQELGFKRRGTRIEATIRAAIEQIRQTPNAEC